MQGGNTIVCVHAKDIHSVLVLKLLPLIGSLRTGNWPFKRLSMIYQKQVIGCSVNDNVDILHHLLSDHGKLPRTIPIAISEGD